MFFLLPQAEQDRQWALREASVKGVVGDEKKEGGGKKKKKKK